MNETPANPPESEASALPAGVVAPVRQRLTMVWIVPLLAILVGIGLAVQAIRARGPEITLQFALAEGLEANKTRVKYKEVAIGTVKSISLTSDHKSVLVRVQMDKQAEDMLVTDTRFWVVRPRVDASGVTGLGTLLSGAYIAIDPGKSGEYRDEFTGLDVPPAVTSETPGRSFFLNADNLGSLDIGAPVYFRRLQVGRVIGYTMQKDGKGVEVKIFIDAPYDRFVTPNARFWHASGFDFSLDSEGAKFNMQSVASLVLGGIAFAEPENGGRQGAPAEADTRFTLHAAQSLAMRSPDHGIQRIRLTFKESIRGLSVGAPVDFRGITIGEVSRIDLRVDEALSSFRIDVELIVDPARFLPNGAKLSRPALDRLVGQGLRAQLRTGSMITGQRYVALDFFPASQPRKIAWRDDKPQLPVLDGQADGLQERLPELVESLHATIEHANQLIVRLDKDIAPEFTRILQDARQTLDSADKLFNSANKNLVADAPLQREMLDTLREVGKAASAVRELADLLERHPEALLTGKKGN